MSFKLLQFIVCTKKNYRNHFNYFIYFTLKIFDSKLLGLNTILLNNEFFLIIQFVKQTLKKIF